MAFCTFSTTILTILNVGSPGNVRAQWDITDGPLGCTLPGSNPALIYRFYTYGEHAPGTVMTFGLHGSSTYYQNSGTNPGPPYLTYTSAQRVSVPVDDSITDVASFFTMYGPVTVSVMDGNTILIPDIVWFPPTANSAAYTVAINSATPITLTGALGSGPGPLAYTQDTSPSLGSVTGSVPALTYHAPAAPGSTSFTFHTNDGEFNSIIEGVISITIQQPFSITSIDPIFGPIEGNTFVTITGVGFDAGTTFKLDGLPVTNLSFISSTSMTGRTPAHAVGTVDLTGLRSTGETASLLQSYTYFVTPNLNGSPPWQTQGQWAMHRFDMTPRQEGPSGTES